MLADRPLRAALAVGLVLRVLPVLTWRGDPCVRDECTYLELAEGFARGRGMTGSEGWLWAPAYPWLLHVLGVDGVVIAQVLVSLGTIGLLHHLGTRELGPRVGRVAAWVWSLSPTVVFYAGHLWSETFYTALLVVALVALSHAREGRRGAGVALGLAVGGAVLFRGVATYLLPIFVVALVLIRRRREALAATLTAVLAVAPYSAWATHRFGGLVVSDRTLGQMMWLGDNDFAPVTFDWGNGVLLPTTWDRVVAGGRPHCRFEDDPVAQDDCEVARGRQWITEHPGDFVRRIPVRIAQMFNPNSFLTRQLRQGKWKGLPAGVDEALVVAVAATSLWTGVVGAWGVGLRARRAFGATVLAVVAYHVAAIAILAGLSRYRFPLEAPLTCFAAWVSVDARGAWRGATGLERALAVGLALFVLGESLVYLSTGWS